MPCPFRSKKLICTAIIAKLMLMGVVIAKKKKAACKHKIIIMHKISFSSFGD